MCHDNVLLKQLRDVSSTVSLDNGSIDDCDDENTNECSELESGIQITGSELSEEWDIGSEGHEAPPFSPLPYLVHLNIQEVNQLLNRTIVVMKVVQWNW